LQNRAKDREKDWGTCGNIVPERFYHGGGKKNPQKKKHKEKGCIKMTEQKPCNSAEYKKKTEVYGKSMWETKRKPVTEAEHQKIESSA